MSRYVSKYSRYITKNSSRFAEDNEIKASFEQLDSKKSGAPVYYDEKGMMYVNSQMEMHELNIGPTGCKKSTCVNIPRVLNSIRQRESIIVNDSKGEIYAATSRYAQSKGVKVRVVDLKTFRGDSWNPFIYITKIYKSEKIEDAEKILNDLIKRCEEPAVKEGDEYWTVHGSGLIQAIALMLMDSAPESEYVSFKNIANFISEQYYQNFLELQEILNPESLVYTSLKGALVEAEKTRSCIFSTAMQILKPFLSNSAMMKMMIKDTVDIENIADEPTIIYIIYPDEVHTMDFIVNLFFSQAYEILIQKAESNESGKLPIRVNFIIDEFGNLPSIEDFSNRISKSRSANIRFSLSVQSLQQIEEKYVKSYESIISNCALWIVFPSREMALLNRLSDIGGKVIDFNGVSHPLLDPIELQYLEKTYEYAEVIILKMGLRPYMTRLKDYRHIAEYKEEISPNEVGVIHMAPYGKCVRDENYILSFEQWYSLIRAEKEGFKMPFPINSHYNEKNSKRFQEELDKKYDNIFGTGTND